MKVAYYTEEGLRALKAELDQLRDVERPRASQAIAEARDKGDLSENANSLDRKSVCRERV